MADLKVTLAEVPPDKLEDMQKAGDALVKSLLVMLPPQGETPQDHYDSFCQHTIFGNAAIRVMIAMADNMGPLDIQAIRIAAYSALNYVAKTAQSIDMDNPPTVN